MLHSVTIEPPPAAWRDLPPRSRAEATFLGRSAKHWQTLTRTELLGGDPHRVIATGHQPGFFHPGVLAKYLALDAAGAALSADALVEVVVDQDVGDLRSIRVPVIDSEEVLTAASLPWSLWPGEEPQSPTGRQPPLLVDPHAWRLAAGDRFALPQVEPRCRAMGRALGLLARSESRAEQTALAAALLREVDFANHSLPRLGTRAAGGACPPRYMVTASSLPTTSLWRAIIDRMREEPQAACESYNAAVAAQPAAGVAPLETRGSGGCEVPCWLITDDGLRHRAFEHDLRRPDALLWPRALLMTGLVRLALCDLFIHGTSGFEYDRITERWFDRWLDAPLAPRTMTTATMTLDFEHRPEAVGDLAHARWMMHHLPFNVHRFISDPEAKAQHEAIVNEIESLPRRSALRLAAFERLRTFQRDLLSRHPQLIDEARRRLRVAQRRMDESTVIGDRTWAFPLHDPESLAALAERVRDLFKER